MIVTCEECATRFVVESAALGQVGRKVKCARCGHVWFQDSLAEPTMPAAPPTRHTPPSGGAQPAERTAGSRLRAAVAWMVFFVLVGGLAGVVYAGRGPIVSAWPPAVRLYQTLGIDTGGAALYAAAAVAPALEYLNISSEVTVDETGETLWVRGDVYNGSDEERAVPLLRASLSDGDDRLLGSWTFSLAIDRLGPGEVASFETSVNDPDEARAKLELGVAAH